MRKLIDLTGYRFGDLVVLERAGGDGYKRPHWRCRCEHVRKDGSVCGKIKIVSGNNLVRGITKTCGCISGDRVVDITGMRFGDFVVIGPAGCSNDRGQAMWRCRCEHVKRDGLICGNIRIVCGVNLRCGASKTCGCARGDSSRKYTFTDPKTAHRLAAVHYGMISRCQDESNRKYVRYGGRGIKVCEEWKDAKAFLMFCVGRGWRIGLQIHRIDNEGDYCPENVEFLTRDEHMQRHRSTYRFGAETVTRKVVSRLLGLTVDEVKRLTCAGRIDQRIAEYLTAHPDAVKDGGKPILPPSMSKPAA